MCGSRSVLLPGILFYILFISSENKGTSKVISFMVFVFFTGIYIILGGKGTYLYNMIISIFDSNNLNMGGSSVDLRMNQLAAATELFSRSPITGNGPQYLSSLSEGSELRSAMLGSESYIFKLLIENGIIGLATNLYFFIGVFRIANKDHVRLKANMLKCITGAFLLFSISTGTQGAWYVFLPILAYSLTKNNVVNGN